MMHTIEGVKVPRGVAKVEWSNRKISFDPKYSRLSMAMDNEVYYLERLATKPDLETKTGLLHILENVRTDIKRMMLMVVTEMPVDQSKVAEQWADRGNQKMIAKFLADKDAPPVENTTRAKMDRLKKERKERIRAKKELKKSKK
jgi:hypothetical protein